MRQFLALTRALSDETRVRALMALKDGELCVCQLIELLGLAPSTVSKHMSILMGAGLVELRKEGRWRFYRLAAQDAPGEARAALGWALGVLREDAVILGDNAKLSRLREKDLVELCACYRS